MPDKDVIEGVVKNLEGRVQEAWGDLTDNPQEKAAGQEKQAKGKLQESAGHLKDAAHAAADSVKP